MLNMKHIKFLLIAVCLFASIAACNKKEDPDNIVPVESVTIAPEQITLTVGQTHQLEVTVLPENATDQTVKWRTSDASIVSIDNGEITANAAGTASITAKVGGKEATCTVNVAEKVIPVTSVSIEPKQLEMIPGQTTAITVTLLPENATDKTVVWSSSEETVATVSDTGLVQAVAEGTTTISATSLDGEVSGECLVTVMAAENMTGSRQDVITQDDFGGSGSTGDDVSGGSGASQGIEDSNKNGINYVYGENTVAVTDAVMEKVSNLTKEGFKLPADSHGRSSIGYGDVFVFPKCEQFPGGYAAKVTDISWEGDGFYYSTTLAAIDEVFETLHLEQTALDLTPYIEKIVMEDGTEVEWTKTKGGVSISIPEIFGGINGLSFDLNDNVSISPSAEINFNLDVDTDVVGNKLTYAKVQANSSARLSADVSIKKGGEKKWVSKRAKVIIAAIPVGPVWVTPEVYATFEIRLSGEINMTFSFNYQKAYFAYISYDSNKGIEYDGDASVSSSEDPFAVTGNLSGGIEFGPNVGAGVSLWGGALGLGVYCGPHAAFSFTGTLPFTAENLAKLDRPGMWLSNAYYEPSALLRYGGSVEVAYLWHKDYEAPVTFNYSFGKTFMIPKLGNTLSIETSQNGSAKISTTIMNKSLFNDNMYVVIRKDGPEGPVLFKCPFKMSRKPEAEDDEVKITASLSDLDIDETYYVDGPFISVSALGFTKEVEMEPVQDVNRYINGRAVDLGLSVKWASYNVGATAPEEYGDYFAWGETSPKSDYSHDTYRWFGEISDVSDFMNVFTHWLFIIKYCTDTDLGFVMLNIDNTVLAPEDDAAHVNWGGSWRMPTDAEWIELWSKCARTWTTQNGVSGHLVTGPNGNSIFLPAAGGRGRTDLDNTSSSGIYWSSSLDTDNPYRARGVHFLSNIVYKEYADRSFGHSVRPVTE